MPDTLIPIKEYADTTANLVSANPVLLDRQIALETDTGHTKIGDGSTAYNSLPHLKAGARVKHRVSITVDGSGAVLTTGIKGRTQVSFTGTLQGVTLLANASGSVTFGIKKSTYANFPGTMTSIVGSNTPSLSSAQKAEITLDGGWTTSITGGDVLQFEITGSPATITQVTLIMFYNEDV